jgi:heme/copper-type cytochrome/quinol oxidase subunit 3
MATTLPATRAAGGAPATTSATPAAMVVEPQVNKWGAAPLAAAVLGGAQVMVFGALLAGMLLTRTTAREWPPKALFLDNYRGSTLWVTALLMSCFVQWAVSSARQDDQRNAVVANAMTLGLAAAMADLVWYTLQRSGVGAGSSVYATYFYVICGAYLVAVVAGALALGVSLAKTIGGQATSNDHRVLTAVAINTHVLTLIWTAVYFGVWVRR